HAALARPSTRHQPRVADGENTVAEPAGGSPRRERPIHTEQVACHQLWLPELPRPLAARLAGAHRVLTAATSRPGEESGNAGECRTVARHVVKQRFLRSHTRYQDRGIRRRQDHSLWERANGDGKA